MLFFFLFFFHYNKISLSCSPIIFTFDSKPLYEGTLVLATLVQKPDAGSHAADKPSQEPRTSLPSRKNSSVNDLSAVSQTSSRDDNLPPSPPDRRGEVAVCSFLFLASFYFMLSFILHKFSSSFDAGSVVCSLRLSYLSTFPLQGYACLWSLTAW